MSFTKIKYDFEKLLIAKAKFKVMVFQARSKNVAIYLEKAGVICFL